MTRRPYWAILLLLPLALPTLAAGDSSGFTPLFTGTDLTGWRYGKELLHRQMETSDRRFSVSGGVLSLASKDRNGQKPQKDLMSVRDFSKDFVLRLEFKADQEAICSVLIRNHAFPVADFGRRGEQKQLKHFNKDD